MFLPYQTPPLIWSFFCEARIESDYAFGKPARNVHALLEYNDIA
jgi:hypothetical protein